MSTTTKTAVRRGFACKCIHCGEPNQIRVYLDDITGVESCISCGNCDSEFNLDDVKQFINSWQKVIAWMESAPEYIEE